MQEMAITGLRHPARAGEVAVVDEAGALGLPIRIEAEDDLDCLFPVRALFVRVEQAQIGDEMPLVIGGQLGAVRRAIFEGGGIHVRRFRVGLLVNILDATDTMRCEKCIAMTPNVDRDPRSALCSSSAILGCARALPYAALNVGERRFVENTPW
jgi:hypothetical protein